ncbi:glycogen synthase [Streptomyces griseus]|uniref:Glycogen synthase n=1 Tax=Streptomyces sp. CMC78 TaxID=3231512 RepID=A0AB33KCB9_9ACTN|nr:glycogen/starch synthase [Streptomyces sp. ID01-9D]MDX5572198.1 glycogen/starch synthase [Streptomyces sp. ID01-9D]WTC86276.1 glycogen synthase [Streptomyces griseus]WTD71106.1 glycogen synthase [Streptomyces griseus]
MKCLYITQEYAPYFVEGGLGVTSSALPATLQKEHGDRHDLVLPYYPWLVERHGLGAEVVCELPEAHIGGVRATATVLRLLGHGGPCDVYLVRADSWYAREGLYRDASYTEFGDAVERAAFFGRCVAEWVERTGLDYDLVHGNDWQSGAALAQLRHRDPELPMLLSIHNAEYAGALGSTPLDGLGLPEATVRLLREEAADEPTLLLLGLLSADAAVTCSPGYARELLAQSRGGPFGRALERLKVSGIIFGVDGDVWNPAAGGRMSIPFRPDTVEEGKRLNKQALQRHVGLTESADVPVIGVCSRFVREKGTDLLLAALTPLLRRGLVQLVVVGPGAAEYHEAFLRLAEELPGGVVHLPRFEQETAWLVYAGSDMTLMPSRTEPCGLNQLIALAYGTLPVVSRVGGLQDTVVDLRHDPVRGAGALIPEHTPRSVRDTVLDLMAWMRDSPSQLSVTRRRAMVQDWSWSRTAQDYHELYVALGEPAR